MSTDVKPLILLVAASRFKINYLRLRLPRDSQPQGRRFDPAPRYQLPLYFNYLQTSSGLQVRRSFLFCRDFAEIFFTVETFFPFVPGNQLHRPFHFLG